MLPVAKDVAAAPRVNTESPFECVVRTLCEPNVFVAKSHECGNAYVRAPWHVGCTTARRTWRRKGKGIIMLYWAAVFFVIALVAAVLGFGGIAAGAAGIAKILFIVFLALAALALVFNRRLPA
jgi:uncharacterized membrane protein YtjA (UPF0391 family)